MVVSPSVAAAADQQKHQREKKIIKQTHTNTHIIENADKIRNKIKIMKI